jgi:hypothetical protein
LLTGIVMALAGAASVVESAGQMRCRAVAFGGFAIFDLRSVPARTEAAVAGQGAALTQAWRNRQFQYQWLRHSWVNRLDAPAQERGHVTDGTGRDLAALLRFLHLDPT